MKNNTIGKIELLSPAGNLECFYAAIRNGADAVYLAGEKYGARAYAGNFNSEGLIEALHYAHLYGKKVFLTVNTVLKDNEICELYDFINPFYQEGLDAVIVQDIGVVAAIKQQFPELPIHASTQMSITDINGINVMKNLGVERVVLARELSIDEISRIIQVTGMPVECFAHGAMCYCYSGKCLFSGFLGERSGNRGRCAQPCRLNYNNNFPLSMKDMYTLHILPKLIESGISSLKIEGRMKSPEYVACVTGIYRKYIDLCYESPNDYKIDLDDERLLLDLYTRSGNCEGYYFEKNGKDMITADFPGYNSEKSDNNPMVQYYTDKLCDSIMIDAYASFLTGEKASLTLQYNDISITACGDIVEKADKQPLTKDAVLKQLNKTGSTVFKYNNLYVEISDNAFMPVSRINALRRDAMQMLEDRILSSYKRNEGIKNTCDYKNKTIINNEELSFDYAAEVNNTVQLKEVLKFDFIKRIIIPARLFVKNQIDDEMFSKMKEKRIYLKMPYVLRKNANVIVEKIKQLQNGHVLSGVYVCNYEELDLINEIRDDLKSIISDIHLYCNSSISRYELLKLGVTNTTVPIELNKAELLKRGIVGEEMIIYGRAPLMVSAQCIRKTESVCTKSPGFVEIIDRKGISFPVFCNCDECCNIIYNSVPTFLEKDIDIIKRLGIECLRICFTDEDVTCVRKILNHYSGKEIIKEIKHTKGHYLRGVE